MPRGYLGDYARRVTSVKEETQIVEIHIQWTLLSCGHTLRFTGGKGRRRVGTRLNCPNCEFEHRQPDPEEIQSA